MHERQSAELLIVRLRWLALVAGALLVDNYAETPLAGLLILGVFYYNTIATLITGDTSLFEKYRSTFIPLTRVLDFLAITSANYYYTNAAGTTYLFYCLLILSSGYVYARFRPIITSLIASIISDSVCVIHTYSGVNSVHNTIRLIAIHSAMFVAAALVTAYIIAFLRQHERMSLKERKLNALFDCGTRFTSARDLDQLLKHIIQTAVLESGATYGLITLLRADTGELEVTAEYRDEEAQPVTDRSIEKWVATSGHPAFPMGSLNGQRSSGSPGSNVPAICVPLLESAPNTVLGTTDTIRVLGTLSVYKPRNGRQFVKEDLDLLRMLAFHAAMGVVNARLYRELHSRFLRTLQSLARSLEARDPYTQGHSYRVSEISLLVAKQLGLPSQQTEALRNAALLHDIGKIGVPDAVLRKPGRLTPEERLIIQTHPVTGENICRPLNLGEDVLFLIRHHQERLNGTGYPDQLPAYQQPLALRILCAVDALDAMSSDRPYRKALSAAERVEQLDRGAGIEFDRQVVQVLKSLLASGVLDQFYAPEQGDEALKAA